MQTRSVVGLLRGGDDAQSPVPGLVSLETLVQGVREAGLHVDMEVDGTRREVPALVDLAAYRVVQEALTNAVKHAPDHPATVRISYAPTALRVMVGTTGTGQRADLTPAGPGFGLLGLQERARAVGGRFTAGATPDGGFQVCADLPTGADPR
jgi:signal transduction histidine kinase